ncbi:MAG: glycosyltransferase family 39 protein [Acidobacteriia bacterium]|nr:glycosyltransferase family 39 protein [Terriglobia bacterium]
MIHSSALSPTVDFAANAEINLLSRLLSAFWRALPFIALAAALVYPFYKHIQVGLILVAGGAAFAILPGFAPRLAASIAHFVDCLSNRKFLLIVCAAGLLLRLPMILHPGPLGGDNAIYVHSAQSIASGLGFGDYIVYPPGQAFWFAFWIAIFGADLHLLSAVQCGLSIASAPITYFGFARYSKSGARWSAIFIAAYPAIVIWSGSLGHETTVIFLFSILFLILSRPSFAYSPKLWVLCGLAAGVTALVRPTMVIFPALVACALVVAVHSVRKAVAPVLITTLAMALAIAPWTIRNYLRFHEFALISTNFGGVLLSANHPESDGIYMEVSQIGKGLSRVEQDRLQRRLAVQSILSNPRLFAKRVVMRIIVQWGGETSIVDSVFGTTPSFGQTVRQLLRSLAQLAWVWFLSAWCIGVVRLRTMPLLNDLPISWVVCLTALIFVMHSILEPIARHHLPLLPFAAGISLPAYGDWLVRKAMGIAPSRTSAIAEEV